MSEYLVPLATSKDCLDILDVGVEQSKRRAYGTVPRPPPPPGGSAAAAKEVETWLLCSTRLPFWSTYFSSMHRYEHCKWSQDTMNIPRRIGANKHCAGQSRDFTPIEVHGTFEYYYPVPVRRERRKKVNNGLTVDRARCIASRTRLGR